MTKLFGTLFNLSISNLSTSDFKLVKSTYLANSDVSTSVAFLKSTFTLAHEDFGSGKYSLIYIISFSSIRQLKNYRRVLDLTYSLLLFLFITFSTLNSF